MRNGRFAVVTTACVVLLLGACTQERLAPTAAEAVLDEVAVGEFLFKDKRLSLSGNQSCATCHDEHYGHADTSGVHLPLGGGGLDLAGRRSSPTTRYLNKNTAFRIDAQGNAWGGFNWDGRADSRALQGGDPFFVAVEMALPGDATAPQALLELVRSAGYYPQLSAFYAGDDLTDDEVLFARIKQAIETYQRDDADYNLFNARYDAFLAGTGAFSAEEREGLAIFNDPARGNCASCHESRAPDGKPVFTDFGFRALGVPRNPRVPENIADAGHYDLGLCASGRKEPARAADPRYCGMFKTPTLRNVARTAPYFHNASVATLEEAVLFHFTRESDPARWYGSATARYNDLPPQHHRNVVQGKPFDGSWQPKPAELAALVAFLQTLDDADQTAPLLAVR